MQDWGVHIREWGGSDPQGSVSHLCFAARLNGVRFLNLRADLFLRDRFTHWAELMESMCKSWKSDYWFTMRSATGEVDRHQSLLSPSSPHGGTLRDVWFMIRGPQSPNKWIICRWHSCVHLLKKPRVPGTDSLGQVLLSGLPLEG